LPTPRDPGLVRILLWNCRGTGGLRRLPLTQKAAGAAEQTEDASEELSRLAATLRELVSRFRLE